MVQSAIYVEKIFEISCQDMVSVTFVNRHLHLLSACFVFSLLL